MFFAVGVAGMAAFDLGLASAEGRGGAEHLTGELPLQAQPPAGQPDLEQSAYSIGVAGGVPAGVAAGYLTQLGLDESTPPGLFLDFDPADLAEAKREFQVDFGPATALHRAQVTSWLRLVGQVVGTRAPTMLEEGFVPAGPVQRAWPAAPSGPGSDPQLPYFGRAGEAPEMSAAVVEAAPARRLLQAAPKAAA